MTTTITTRQERIDALKASIVDRVRENERQAAPNGYCRHGRFVGGMGIDWICQPCEDGVPITDEVDGYVDALVQEVRDVLEISAIIERTRDRIGFETPITATLREALQSMCRVIWDCPDRRAVYQLMHDTTD